MKEELEGGARRRFGWLEFCRAESWVLSHSSSLNDNPLPQCNNVLISKSMATPDMAKPAAPAQEDILSAHTPLLSDQVPGEEPDQVSAPSTPLSVLILYFMAIHFLLAFCEIILVAPLIKLLENSLCLSYYDFPGNGVQEELCKIPEIQGPLATLRGWQSTFNTIPGIFC